LPDLLEKLRSSLSKIKRPTPRGAVDVNGWWLLLLRFSVADASDAADDVCCVNSVFSLIPLSILSLSTSLSSDELTVKYISSKPKGSLASVDSSSKASAISR
jgi:hypothetical protein